MTASSPLIGQVLAEVDLSVPMLTPGPAPAPHYLHGFGHMSGELRGGPGPRPVPVMSTSSSSLHTLEVKIARTLKYLVIHGGDCESVLLLS